MNASNDRVLKAEKERERERWEGGEKKLGKEKRRRWRRRRRILLLRGGKGNAVERQVYSARASKKEYAI